MEISDISHQLHTVTLMSAPTLALLVLTRSTTKRVLRSSIGLDTVILGIVSCWCGHTPIILHVEFVIQTVRIDWGSQ